MPTLDITPSGQACGATVHGVDLRAIDVDTVAAIRSAWLTHKVLAFPGQDLSDDDLESFTLRFGPFGNDPFFAAIDGHPHVAAIMRTADETSSLFAENWHADWSFQEYPPDGTCLYSKVIPPTGGDTLYADQQAALAAMPDDLRGRLEGRTAIHSARGGYAPDGTYGDDDTAERSMRIRPSVDAYATQTPPVHPDPPRNRRRDVVFDHRLHHRHQGHGRQRGPAADWRALCLADPRGIPVPPPLGAQHACHVGQPLHPAPCDRRVRGPRPACCTARRSATTPPSARPDVRFATLRHPWSDWST